MQLVIVNNKGNLEFGILCDSMLKVCGSVKIFLRLPDFSTKIQNAKKASFDGSKVNE